MQLPVHIWSSSELPPVIVWEPSVHETFDVSVEEIHAHVWPSVAELLKNSWIVFASQRVEKPIQISTEWKNPDWMVH
jgi:hypothetical protein